MVDNNTYWTLLVDRLQDAKIGDSGRLDSIKKYLESGKAIYESDRQYLKEKSKQLEDALEHQSKVEWTIDFIQRLEKAKRDDSMTLNDVKSYLESEKATYKIDEQFLKETAEQLKQAVDHQRKAQWALDFIDRLQHAKIGDPGRLNSLKKSLEGERTIFESDWQYLKEKSKQLQSIVDNQTKAQFALEAIKKLQESEMRSSERLDAIKKALQEGSPVAESELRFLNTKYEQLQQTVDNQRKVEWTLDVIKQLKESEIGNPQRLDAIKIALEEGRIVEESEVSYLKEKYKLLQKIDETQRKVEWTLDVIKQLKESEIGNPQRLDAIKIALEEGKTVEENEISYLKEKFEQLLVIKKSKKAPDIDRETEATTQTADYDAMKELNAKIAELGKKQEAT